MKQSILLILIAIIIFNLNAQNNPFSPVQTDDSWKTESLLENNSTIKRMDSLITANEFKNISSVVIAYKGKVVFENYCYSNSVSFRYQTRTTFSA
jgi:hypothetical protein